jgi:hypothetical protein
MKHLTLALLIFASAGCDEPLTDVTGPTPNLEVSFSSIAQEILATTDSSGRVACTPCHTNQGRTPAAGLNLLPDVAYQNLVNRSSGARPDAILVIPGDPDSSYLVRKLEGGPDISGQRMPRTSGPFLTEGQIMVIRQWIRLGADNN